ncbi:MAG TPA: RCC1 domain-containing protein, partial [Gemmatimonadales bacterium]
VASTLLFTTIYAGEYDSTSADGRGLLTSAHSCAFTRITILVYCWGDNSVGQLGIGNRIDSHAPVKVAGQP